MKYLLLLAAVSLVGCGPNDAGLARTMEPTKDQLAAIENRITPFSVVSVEGVSDATIVETALPGEAIYAGCVACHGAQGQGGVGPALAGKGHEYIMGRLMAYKAGETVGSQSNLMWAQAGMLSDQQIHQVTEYIDTL